MGWSDRNYRENLELRREFSGWRMAAYLVAGNIIAAVLLWPIGGGVMGDGFRQMLDVALGLKRTPLIHGQIWRLFTYSWIHAGVGHIFWNMIMLFFTGMILEGLIGSTRLLRIYLAFGAAAGLAVIVPTQFSNIPTIGASGAIMGLVVFLGSAYPFIRITWWIFSVPCWLFAAVLVTLDVLNVAAQMSDGTAHNVHLGGAAAGFAYGFVWPRLEDRLEEWHHRWVRHRAVKQSAAKVEETLELDRVLEKINQGGMSQLSERERRFLLDQSEKKRKSLGK